MTKRQLPADVYVEINWCRAQQERGYQMTSVLAYQGTRPAQVKLPCGCVVERGDRVTISVPIQGVRKQPFLAKGHVIGFGTHVPTVVVRYQKKDSEGLTRSYTAYPLESYVRKGW